jgi:hypothetical protein
MRQAMHVQVAVICGLAKSRQHRPNQRVDPHLHGIVIGREALTECNAALLGG